MYNAFRRYGEKVADFDEVVDPFNIRIHLFLDNINVLGQSVQLKGRGCLIGFLEGGSLLREKDSYVSSPSFR
jgi:hypothetical protein